VSDEVPKQRRKLSAILMADVSGFSRMMSRDEEGTTARIQDFHRRVLGLVERYEGRVVDTAGDSVFGEFDSVVQAVRCAQALQEDQARVNEGASSDERIDTRIGVHLGDVIVEDYRVYGDGVNIAARLETLADPGGIFVSEAVYQQVHNKLELPFEDLGLQQLKNIDHPLRVFRVAPENLGHPPKVEVRGASLPATVPPVPASPPAEPAEAPAPGARQGRRARRKKRAHREQVRAGQQNQAGQRARAVRTTRKRAVGTWAQEVQRPGTIVQVIIGGFLLMSPLFAFPTGGVFPTGGAVLLATSLGRIWNLKTRSRWKILVALGGALVLGAFLTNWSPFTNAAFALGGLLCVALGVTNDLADTRRREQP